MQCAVGLFEAGIRPAVLLDYCASAGGYAAEAAGRLILERMIGREQLKEGKTALLNSLKRQDSPDHTAL